MYIHAAQPKYEKCRSHTEDYDRKKNWADKEQRFLKRRETTTGSRND